ncbi:MAG: glutamine--fructose-6-phosphate transaminase (isomerizing) [Xanthomonadales bacterium]|nr:glutamine--fructose-6-phosphate transaminase (isomerizing) [Xanthomonadales bacterium]
MCGIVAATAMGDIVPLLINGLKALEYRGYDSAGLAVLSEQQLRRLRAQGKVSQLEALQQATPLVAPIGIAHTRWATHGIPSERNAHPHASRDRVSVVHNGIIENHAPLRQQLVADGYEFQSDTDTEVIAHLIEQQQAQGLDLLTAVQRTVARLEGAFALAVLSAREPTRVIGARRGSPLVLGLGDGEGNYLASDVYALLGRTRRFIYLEEGDIAALDIDSVQVFDSAGTAVERPVKTTTLHSGTVDKGGYRHFMLKEIHEQTQAVADTLEGRIHNGAVLTEIFGVHARELLSSTKAVRIIACGSSHHAALVARYWIESLAGIPCFAEIASEYRYRDVAQVDGTLFVTVSQSGETSDTLAALRHSAGRGYLSRLAICNVPESSLVRESELVLMTRAGPEIGVASTKAFVTQLVALALLALELGRARGIDQTRYTRLVAELQHLPTALAEALALDGQIENLAETLVAKNHALFLGRGVHFPIAMEGALKLKEISYIHAEAYPAGELKHGPLALVDESMPVVAVAPNDQLVEKLLSNIEEVRARGGEMYVFADANVAANLDQQSGHVMALPPSGFLTSPIIFTVPLQLLAYHVAVLKGTDVDQPRNLAKSVTVE